MKDKTFYFFDYQGYTINQGATYLSTVPSAKMRAGDFSELNRVIFDPVSHLPFPGNVIPQNRWDPAREEHPRPADSRVEHRRHLSATRADDQQLPDQPHARAPGQPDRPQGRSLPDSSNNRLCDALQLREDTPRPAGDAAARRRRASPSAPATATSRRRASRMNDTHTFNSNWLNEVRFGWSSIKFLMTPVDYRQQHRAGRRPPRTSTSARRRRR